MSEPALATAKKASGRDESEAAMTPEEKLQRAIFGHAALDFVSLSDKREQAESLSEAAAENISISDHLDLFHSPAWMRVGLIRAGVPARDVKALQERLNMPQGLLLDSLKISPATLNRKVGRKDNLSPEDSERVVGIAKMIGQVEEIVRQSGEIEGFDAAQWLSEWLQQPAPALAGARPLDFLDTVEGQAMVSGLIAQMQSGAYA